MSRDTPRLSLDGNGRHVDGQSGTSVRGLHALAGSGPFISTRRNRTRSQPRSATAACGMKRQCCHLSSMSSFQPRQRVAAGDSRGRGRSPLAGAGSRRGPTVRRGSPPGIPTPRQRKSFALRRAWWRIAMGRHVLRKLAACRWTKWRRPALTSRYAWDRRRVSLCG